MKKISILFVGESCMAHSLEMKGHDSFTTTRYNEPALIMKKVFEDKGHSFTHVPCHKVHGEFPEDIESLKKNRCCFNLYGEITPFMIKAINSAAKSKRTCILKRCFIYKLRKHNPYTHGL